VERRERERKIEKERDRGSSERAAPAIRAEMKDADGLRERENRGEIWQPLEEIRYTAAVYGGATLHPLRAFLSPFKT